MKTQLILNNLANSKRQQIVVMKGWEGFADRLQVLSHCLNYCKLYNAAICVDWRDNMWGQNSLNFDDYFEIVGIPVISLENVLVRVKNGATILPAAWNYDSLADIPSEAVHFANYTSPITNSYNQLNSEIIVNNGKGLRMWHLDNLINNIRLKKPISDIVIERLQKLESPYTAIHLRGTDRLENKTPVLAIKPAVDALAAQPPHVSARIYVISDMNEMIKLWTDKFKQSKILYKDYEIYKLPSGTQGTHQLPKEALDFYGIKKKDMNIDTITDFLIICFSNWCYGNSKDSTFTSLAKFMTQGGRKGMSRWLHGFEPVQKTLAADQTAVT